ncbi:MAG: amino acid--[acyl-carrier-protein] ligase [Clostridia bacterium]|nr:amino acid--[acyl-carrier-protein] ligase [Deltaproteobacteria bacterium]
MTYRSPDVFFDELVAARILLPTGVDGIPGRSAQFEDIGERFYKAVLRAGADDQAESMHFPPAINRKMFEKAGFLKSFPQLAASIFSFYGDEKQHRELVNRIDHGHAWADLQGMTDCCLIPSACYPVYPEVARTGMPAQGRIVYLWAYCYRNEPSKDPARMQMFRQLERVCLGTQEKVLAWRETWMKRGMELLTSLSLPATLQNAADPFFGRAGRMLAANQREQGLKFEIVVPVTSEEKPTACASFNYHQEHFSGMFGIKLPDGSRAQTACLGFGLERCVLALYSNHGLNPDDWPASVRKVLWQ